MHINKAFDQYPRGAVVSFEEFYLTQEKGNWVPDPMIDRMTYQFDPDKNLVALTGFDSQDSKINLEVRFEYSNGLLIKESSTSKWGTSDKVHTYNSAGLCEKIRIANSSQDKILIQFEYAGGRVIREITRQGHLENVVTYRYHQEEKILTVETFRNTSLTMVKRYNAASDLISTRGADKKVTEFTYDRHHRVIIQKEETLTKKIYYDDTGFPLKLVMNSIGLDKLRRYRDVETYETDVDAFGNWVSVRCFVESDMLARHLKSIRVRKIAYGVPVHSL